VVSNEFLNALLVWSIAICTIAIVSRVYVSLILLIHGCIFKLLDKVAPKTPGWEDRGSQMVVRVANVGQVCAALLWSFVSSLYCVWLANKLNASWLWSLFTVIPFAARDLDVRWPESPFHGEARPRKGARSLSAFVTFLSMSFGWAVLGFFLSEDYTLWTPLVAGGCSFLAASSAWCLGKLFFSLRYTPDHGMVDVRWKGHFVTAGVMLTSFIAGGVVGGIGGWWLAVVIAVCYGLRRGFQNRYWYNVDLITKMLCNNSVKASATVDEAQETERAYRLAVEAVDTELRGGKANR